MKPLAVTPLRAVASLVLLISLILVGLFGISTPQATAPSPTAAVYNDLTLYRDVVTDMRGGASYYEAAISEARKHDYPLRPFVTVRLPTLAWLLSATGEAAGHFGLMGLAFVTLCAWARKLKAEHLAKPQFTLAMICITTGLCPALIPPFEMFHETWAGLLIALSLAVRRKDAWALSVLIGLAAALTRELAGAYLLVMAVMALKERNTREASAWVAAIAMLALVLAIHALHVNALVTPDDFASPGWLGFGGWRFVLQTLRWNACLILSPSWLAALLVPLALFGFTDLRSFLVVGGYVAAFFVVGRSDNYYWGLLIAPLWPLGLACTSSVLTAHLSAIRSCFCSPQPDNTDTAITTLSRQRRQCPEA